MNSSRKRLVVNCWGGLGNQMFEYAAGLYFAAKTERTLEIVRPLAKNENWNGWARPFQLEQFAISHRAIAPRALDRIFLSTHPKVRQLASLLSAPLNAVTLDEPQTYHFAPCLLEGRNQSRVYLSGFWQSAAYVEGAASTLRSEYRLRTPANDSNLKYAQQIEALSCPVSLHLRLGDYSQITHTSASGQVLNLVLRKRYYQDAVASIKQMFPAHTLIVFSDDQTAARAFLADQPNCLFIEGNDAATAHEDMRLMSLCRHHIIANSSFSWWGAWLNSRSDKQVFAPRFWGNTRESYYPDLFPASWHILDNLL